MTDEPASLRADVEAAVIDDVAALGLAFDRAGLVKRFLGRGASRATLYRWVDAVVRSGRPGELVAREVKAAVAERVARGADPVAEAVEEVKALVPIAVTLDDLVGGGVRGVVDRLGRCVEVAERLMAHASTPDGGVKNARLLLQGSEHLRRTIATAVSLHDSMKELSGYETFMKSVLAALGEASPETAERAVRAMTTFATTQLAGKPRCGRERQA